MRCLEFDAQGQERGGENRKRAAGAEGGGSAQGERLRWAVGAGRAEGPDGLELGSLFRFRVGSGFAARAIGLGLALW